MIILLLMHFAYGSVDYLAVNPRCLWQCSIFFNTEKQNKKSLADMGPVASTQPIEPYRHLLSINEKNSFKLCFSATLQFIGI